ncbi:MAG TPA: CRTAC1 family protein [Gemmataceae bacterium]|nr:CRTAC1 family protein [Gemmataceae bacterium]
MGAWSASRRFAFGAGAAGVAVAGVVVWLTLRGRLEEAKSSPFRECATEVGLTWQMKFLNNEQGEKFKINLYDHGCGLAVGDFDGDGHDDIYFCNQLGKNALYRNKGDGTFVDVAEEAGVALGDRICVAAAFVDYDNDGKPDLFVTSTRGGNVLFHNKGDGTFVDVTKEVGLEHVGHSQTPVFFDYDNDGYLDLFLTNTAEWTTDTYDKTSRHWLGQAQFEKLLRSRKEHNILYHNEPDGKGGRRFVNVTEKSGLKGLGWAGDAVAFDFDDDGKPDLFVTNMFGRSQLYRNNGDGTFTDVTGDRLGRTPHGAVGTNVFDFDNDGRLDLYVVDMHSDMWMGADFNHSSLMLALEWENRKYPTLAGPVTSQDPAALERDRQEDERSGIRHAEVFFGNGFYRNEGAGRFTEISDQAGLETFWPWGITPGDYTNGGYQDVFIPSGMGYPFYYWPNYLLMNQGDGTFRNRAKEMGIEPPPRGTLFPERISGRAAARSSRAAATGDFRGDGRLDIVVNNFNDQPYYFKNQSPRKNYVAFRLTGTSYQAPGPGKKSSRDALGAVVRLYQGEKVMTRQVQGAGGYLSQSSRTVHFGLGDRPDIDRVVITWPTGATQELRGFIANTTHEVSEEPVR